MVKRILDTYPDASCEYWNLSRNPEDGRWLNTIKIPRVIVRNDFYDPRGQGAWNPIFQYYSKPQFSDHLFVKLDDDIVFLEAKRFGKFVKAIEKFPGAVMSPIVMNNGASAPLEPGLWRKFQSLDIPLLDVHLDNRFAEMAHRYFFDHWKEMLGTPIEFVPTEDWLSINMIGYDWQTGCEITRRLGAPSPSILAGRKFSARTPMGDEAVVNTLPRVVMRGFLAGHLMYSPQAASEDQLDEWRRRYAEIGAEYLGSEEFDQDYPLPGLSPVSCAQRGDNYAPLKSQLVDKWGRNNWRVRMLGGSNDPLTGRVST